MKKTKRFLSILLVLCMLLGLLPTTVFAAGTSITSYADVQETDWFYDAVKYASENGMMNGTGGGLFSPSMVTNRAMIVTILYRLEGEPEVTGATSFSDVAAGQWYTDAILWAAQKGVVTGYDTGLFGPDDAITREQMATILYRYAQYKEYDTTASGDVTTFTDGSSVSAYAVEAVKWAVGVGLLTGTDKGALLPTGSASRAEVATILMRFCQGFEVELPGDDTPLSGRPSGSGGSGSGGSGSGGSSSDDMSGVPEAPELPEVDGDMTVGASTDPNASAAREEANAAISQWAATQGMVLLENNNNVLPISGNAGTPVALFGVGAYNTIKGGTGSGDVYLKDG
ncbi:S-layer homology domain-containing protein, partial [Pseudoflavonifractor phocaeensis]|uniref:S-layer homology domain-containing protein n=1 Tax=Pseudoflavonifractor phocaeensis TaxID=1870988 RepID=UPI00195D33B9